MLPASPCEPGQLQFSPLRAVSLPCLHCAPTVFPALCSDSESLWKVTPGVDDTELRVSREARVSGQSYLLSLACAMTSSCQSIT